MLVVGEAAWMMESRVGSHVETRFVADIADGILTVAPVEPADWIRIGELVARHADLRLGTVDASIMVLAERLKVKTIATLDRRHFAVVQPAHTDRFTILP